MRVEITLNSTEHEDIIKWLSAQPNRAEALRQAARLAMQAPRPSESLNTAELRRILREELARIQLQAAATDLLVPDADAQAAAALDEMF